MAGEKKGSLKVYEGSGDYAFLAFSHEDRDIVFPDMEFLNEIGVNIFYNEGLEDSSVSFSNIEEKIEKASVFIAFISPNLIDSDLFHMEIETAYYIYLKPIFPIYLKETKLDKGLKNTIGDKPSISKYEMNDEQYYAKFDSELQRIHSQIKRENKSKPLRLLVGLFFPDRGHGKQATMVMSREDRIKEEWRVSLVYISFAHENINLISGDFILFENQKVFFKYDMEIDYGNDVESDSKWLKKVKSTIKKSSIFLFYVSNKSVHSKRRLFELDYALEKNKPICMVLTEELNEPCPRLEEILKNPESKVFVKYKMDENDYENELIDYFKKIILKGFL